jgi:hypothetical protein
VDDDDYSIDSWSLILEGLFGDSRRGLLCFIGVGPQLSSRWSGFTHGVGVRDLIRKPPDRVSLPTQLAY